MLQLNHVIIAGRLTRDPENKEFKSSQCCNLSIALTERSKNTQGEWVEKPCFVDAIAWNGQAEACQKFLKKGDPVTIEGRLQFEQWKTREGKTATKLKVRAQRVQFLAAPKEEPVSA